MQAIPASPSSPASEVARSICGRGLKGNRLQETVSVPITGKFNGGVGFRPGWIQGPRWYYQGSGCPVASHFLGPRPAFVQCLSLPPASPSIGKRPCAQAGWLAEVSGWWGRSQAWERGKAFSQRKLWVGEARGLPKKGTWVWDR